MKKHSREVDLKHLPEKTVAGTGRGIPFAVSFAIMWPGHACEFDELSSPSCNLQRQSLCISGELRG